ncbi:ImpA domain-containing protein [Yersinia pseudotuberculosis]|nr:ImpA domain-containing protein [Yersinia pseudotuberculosis]
MIQSLALMLFRSNGVDLQTAVFYTLARTHKHGLEGFAEGCELLAAIVTSQWEQLWPEQPQARTEILEWFNTRVGTQLHQYSFGHNALQQVYRAEHSLQLLCDKLQRVELKRIPRVEDLSYLMQNTAKRLEKAAEEKSQQRQENANKQRMFFYRSLIRLLEAHSPQRKTSQILRRMQSNWLTLKNFLLWRGWKRLIL